MNNLPTCPFCGGSRLAHGQYASGSQIFLTPLQCKDCDSIRMEGSLAVGASRNELESGWITGNKLAEILKERDLQMK